jgi:hypothetical protein
MTTYKDIHSHNYATAGGISTYTTTYTRITVDTNVVVHQVGHIYYVDIVNGNDGYNGLTPTTAFKTFAQAASVVVDYDQVYVRTGTYYERAAFTKAIKFSNYNGENVVIDGTGVSMSGYQGMIDFRGTSVSWLNPGIEISGFTVQYVGPAPNNVYDAIYGRYLNGIHVHDVIINDVVDSGVMFRNVKNFVINDNLIKNCAHCTANMDESISMDDCFDGDVYDNDISQPDIAGYPGCSIGICAKASTLGGRIHIHNNEVHNMYGNGIYPSAWTGDIEDIYIYNNTIHDIANYGLAIETESGGDCNRIYEYNNLVYKCGKDGVHLSTDPVGTLRDCYIYNNTIAKSAGTYYIGIYVGTSQLDGIIMIKNNCVFWHDADLGADTMQGQICVKTDALAKCTISNNIVYGENDYQTDPNYPEADNNGEEVWADPLFTDWANDDYTLQAGSPCRNAGTVWTNIPMPLTDLLGNTRECGSEIDVGCYEHQE